MEKEQLTQLMAALDEMSGMMDRIRAMLPAEAPMDEAEALAEPGEDEAEVEVVAPAPAADKDVRKSAMVAALRKSMSS
jgi:hypothetical protein